jgi:hypothetical protein
MIKTPIFASIPQFTETSRYQVNVAWTSVPHTLADYSEPYGLDLDPDFQRGHVWTEEQQIRYVEFSFSFDCVNAVAFLARKPVYHSVRQVLT